MKKNNLIIVLLLLSYVSVYSQSTGGFSGLENQLMQNNLKNQLSAKDLVGKDMMPVGNIVVAENYYLGPGDILSLQVFDEASYIEITADNNIFLPRGVGNILVTGKTLAEVVAEIKALYEKRKSNTIVSVGLKKARLCLITLKGNVTMPAVYTLPASYRVSTAITYANNKSMEKMPIAQASVLIKFAEDKQERSKLFSNSGMATVSNYAKRNIIILHKNGSSNLVDLEKATAINDVTYDPYIQQGDVIYVPFQADIEYTKIAVYGAVIRPVVLPYKDGDMLSHLLKFAYGPTNKTDFENIYLHLSNGSKIKIKTDKNFNLISNDVNLEEGSKLIVGKLKNEIISTNGVVSIKGEIDAPGAYMIDKNKTRLKDIIEMAGGYTKKAYLPNAYVLRSDLKEQIPENPKRNIINYVKQSSIVPADTLRFYADVNYKIPNVSVDFVECFYNNNDKHNIFLEDGDVIIIPKNTKKVYVFGQVKRPGFIKYEKGKDYEWYIQQAGGYAENADKKRASIIRAVSKVWLTGEEEIPVYAGDEIYVPNPPSYPPSVTQAKYGMYIAMLNAAITILFTLYTIYKEQVNTKN